MSGQGRIHERDGGCGRRACGGCGNRPGCSRRRNRRGCRSGRRGGGLPAWTWGLSMSCGGATGSHADDPAEEEHSDGYRSHKQPFSAVEVRNLKALQRGCPQLQAGEGAGQADRLRKRLARVVGAWNRARQWPTSLGHRVNLATSDAAWLRGCGCKPRRAQRSRSAAWPAT